MKIIFTNREQFEKSVDIVFSVNTRLDSAGGLNTYYADMIYCFSDVFHGKRAAQRLVQHGITDFTVV